MASNQHSELVATVRGAIGMWRYKRDHEWDRRVQAAEDALDRLVEQYQAARELLVEAHDIIWNEDAPYVAGGEQLLDNLAERIEVYLNSNPASEPEDGDG